MPAVRRDQWSKADAEEKKYINRWLDHNEAYADAGDSPE
jgi:hypothetical protein